MANFVPVPFISEVELNCIVQSTRGNRRVGKLSEDIKHDILKLLSARGIKCFQDEAVWKYIQLHV